MGAGLPALSATQPPQNAKATQTALVEKNFIKEGSYLETWPKGHYVDPLSLKVEVLTTATVYLSLSSELFSIAIMDGEVKVASQKSKPVLGRAGDILVTPLDHFKPERFQYDAAQFLRTLPAAEFERVEPLLKPVMARQKRLIWWGAIEPVGINAQAPLSVEAEAIRRAYLSEPVIITLRTQSKGRLSSLSEATARQFISALAAQDQDTLSALIDPMPFSEVTREARFWRLARQDYAKSVVKDENLLRAATGSIKKGPNALSWIVQQDDGAQWRLNLVIRDKAVFVSSLERLP